MPKPNPRRGKVIECHMPNGPVCSTCKNYDICEAKAKVKGIKPVVEVVEEEEDEPESE